jgi:serine/threonine-protein kinase RsbW
MNGLLLFESLKVFFIFFLTEASKTIFYSKMNKISIEIPSIMENIRIVESFIDNARDKFKIDDDIYGNIMIAVMEAVNNCIKHGNKEDSRKLVSLAMEFADERIYVWIEDEGDGFDHAHLPAPENLELEGGRGIFLMKNLADEVNFQDKGRKVELVFFM